MAWGSLNTLGSNQEKVADTSLTLTITSAVPIDNVIVLVIACNNAGIADGDNGDVSSVSDPGGNAWTKAREHTNGQGAAAAGATVSVWFTKVTAALALNDVITITFSFSPAAKACTAWEFSIGAGNTVTVQDGASLADDAADPGSLNLTVPNAEFLWVRGVGAETPNGTTFTKTAAYQQEMDENGTTGGGAATNMKVCGEFDIFTGTSNASNPSMSAISDSASVLVALKEAPPPALLEEEYLPRAPLPEPTVTVHA